MHRFRTTASKLLSCLLVASSLFAYAPVLAAERIPNDPLFKDQWYLGKIRATEAWNTSLGFEGVIIAVIDSGVDTQHPDLKDNIWKNVREAPGNGIDDDRNGFIDDVYGWDFVDNDNDANPNAVINGDSLATIHGTVSAGVAGARGDNAEGIAGVAWQATIMPLRALDESGNGDVYPIVRAMDYAVANGAKIINLSFAGPVDTNLLAIAARHAYDAGVSVVAAAGNASGEGGANDLDLKPLYPVCLDKGSDTNFIIGVAATDEDDHKASFSNYGSCIDVSAPGAHIISTTLFRKNIPGFTEPYGGYFNGTSLSVPVVSGTIALMLAVNPRLNPGQIRAILENTAVSIDELNPAFRGKLGRGRIDVSAAVLAALPKATPLTEPATSALLPSGGAKDVVVIAPGPGRAPEVRMFTADGTFIRSFMAFASTFRGGVAMTSAKLSKVGASSIVVGAGVGGGPQVRIFDENAREIGNFFAYDPLFRGGVNVAAGDVDGDGKDEIITGAGPGGGPHIRVFSANAIPVGNFFAYDSLFRGGVNVAAGDVTGDSKVEIITWPLSGTALGKVFSVNGAQLFSFPVIDSKTKERLTPKVFDANADGRNEVVLLSAKPGIRAVVLGSDGKQRGTWDAETGLFYSVSGAPAIAGGRTVLGKIKGKPPTVRVFFTPPVSFVGYETSFAGGVLASVLSRN